MDFRDEVDTKAPKVSEFINLEDMTVHSEVLFYWVIGLKY